MALSLNSLPADTATAQGLLWVAAAALLLLVLISFFAALLFRSTWMTAQLRRLDAALARLAPRLWSRVRRRFLPGDWRGLLLTTAAALVVGLTWSFGAITEGWMDQEALYRIDQGVHRAFGGMLSPGAVEAMRLITHAGDVPTMLVVSAVLAGVLLYRRERWPLGALVLATGGGQAVLWSLKAIFARARPGSQLIDNVGASFPSGHAFTSLVLYGFIVFLVWRWTRRPLVRGTVTALLALLVLLVGLSRVLLSVHWTSDVLGGFVIGLAWLLFSLVAARAAQAWWRGRHARRRRSASSAA